MPPMRKSDLRYDLPPELIAQEPLSDRSASRLLVLDRLGGMVEDRVFSELPDLLNAGDLLVFNDTRVIRTRLFGHKQSGGKVQLLIERILSEQEALSHLRASKSPGAGTVIQVDGGYRVKVLGREEELFRLQFLDGRVGLARPRAMCAHLIARPDVDLEAPAFVRKETLRITVVLQGRHEHMVLARVALSRELVGQSPESLPSLHSRSEEKRGLDHARHRDRKTQIRDR